MKTVLWLALTTAIALTAQAKVSDFNDIIVDNVNSQKELHTNIKTNLNEVRAAAQNKRERIVIVDNTKESINVVTDKDFLRYKKELKYYRPSAKAAQERLASELDNAQ